MEPFLDIFQILSIIFQNTSMGVVYKSNFSCTVATGDIVNGEGLSLHVYHL